MKVFHLSMGQDTAGQGAAIAAALRTKLPAWTVHQMRRRSNLFAYPAEHMYDERLARRWYGEADVVHLNQTLRARRLFDGGRGVPVVLHHHGTEYRSRRAEIDAAARGIGAVQVAATLDLLGSPGVTWLPSVVDLDALARYRRPAEGSVIRIAHSPTNRVLKGTDAIIAAVEEVQRRGIQIEFDLIENVGWHEALTRKGRADIFVDQLLLGYGVAAIEAWAMGIPVIAGATEAATRARYRETFGALPYVEADPATLAEVLIELAVDRDAQREWGERGRTHARLYHGQTPVVGRLTTIYDRACGRPYDPRQEWQARGRTYEARFRHGPAFVAQEAALERVLRALPFTTVLDVGCGFGRMGEMITRIRPGVRYTGLDLSPDLLAGARRRLPDAELIEGSVEDFDAQGRHWDLVIVAEVLMHQPPDAVAGIVTALRRLGDRIVTVDWDEPIGPVAGVGNFQHDYRALFGPSATRTQVGRQAIWEWAA